MPKGADGDSNGSSTDICGNTNSGYSGQWTYKALINQGVSGALVAITTCVGHRSDQNTQLLSSDGAKGLNGYVRYWDSCTQTPFLWKSSTRHMINYDDGQYKRSN